MGPGTRTGRRGLLALALAAAGLTAAAPVVLADEIAEWCEVDPDVLRIDGQTYQVRYSVHPGDQRRAHELVAYANVDGGVSVRAPADLDYRAVVVRVN